MKATAAKLLMNGIGRDVTVVKNENRHAIPND